MDEVNTNNSREVIENIIIFCLKIDIIYGLHNKGQELFARYELKMSISYGPCSHTHTHNYTYTHK